MQPPSLLASSTLSLLLLSCTTTAQYFHHPTAHTLTPWEQIHKTLHTYPLAIDSKDPSLFPSVFAPDAFANYTGQLSNMTGIAAIEEGLMASVKGVLSQHMLGTTVVDIHEPSSQQEAAGEGDGGSDGEEGRIRFESGVQEAVTANSTTYFTATLFGTGDPHPTSSHVYLYGQYRDTLVRSEQGWRIKERFLVFMGPNVGDVSLTGG